MKRQSSLIFLLLLFSCDSKQSVENLYDDSAVIQLLNLMDSIAARNPDFELVATQLNSLPSPDREQRTITLRRRNENDPVLENMIEALLELEPYEIYFDRFKNVSRAHFRLAFNSLPYTAPPLPGGIAEAFYDLCIHREAFERWYQTTRSGIDITRCVASAREWVPPGEYPVKKVYAIYDGNAGSFAEQGNAFFNLCSEVITKTPPSKRFTHLHEVGIIQLEGVISHELNHVMAEPFLSSRSLTFSSWEERWKDRITRSIVSEGVAFQRNPLMGFQKTLWEDRATVSSLMKELNRMMIALDNHVVPEDSVRLWYNRLYHEYAASLLGQYLEQTYPDSDITSMIKEHSIIRPDLVHALGWWMVSRITEGGAKPERASELLMNPSSLFTLYNESLEPGMDDLAVDAQVVTMFSRRRNERY